MKVKGVAITQVQIDAAMERMKQGPFRIADIYAVGWKAGVAAGEVGYGFANNVIRKFKRAGKIDCGIRAKLPYPLWKWIGPC